MAYSLGRALGTLVILAIGVYTAIALYRHFRDAKRALGDQASVEPRDAGGRHPAAHPRDQGD